MQYIHCFNFGGTFLWRSAIAPLFRHGTFSELFGATLLGTLGSHKNDQLAEINELYFSGEKIVLQRYLAKP